MVFFFGKKVVYLPVVKELSKTVKNSEEIFEFYVQTYPFHFSTVIIKGDFQKLKIALSRNLGTSDDF